MFLLFVHREFILFVHREFILFVHREFIFQLILIFFFNAMHRVALDIAVFDRKGGGECPIFLKVFLFNFNTFSLAQ
jgi:hypothetical protein